MWVTTLATLTSRSMRRRSAMSAAQRSIRGSPVLQHDVADQEERERADERQREQRRQLEAEVAGREAVLA